MCGILGYINIDGDMPPALDLLTHRGPDAYGTWSKHNVGLGHRRLSIIDLSEEANQPFHNEDNTVHLVANGEIYNFSELRSELISKGHSFKSISDSEILLHGYEEWGIEPLLDKINGMFAFAIYDEKYGEIICARDRIGIKPLFYYSNKDQFAFSSELSALKKISGERNPEISEDAKDAYFVFGYIPGDLTIYNNFSKLLPGHYLVFSENQAKTCKYWGPSIPQEKESVSIEHLENLLKESVSKRMISDRPLGTFLSGGVDSSLITAIASKSTNDLKTFSIGFEYAECNESEYAKKISDYLKTDHNELFCTEKEALEIVQKIPSMFGEPFADISAIPTYLLTKLTREHVVVALSGDGGDELTWGYNHYAKLAKLERFSKLPLTSQILPKIASLADKRLSEKLQFILTSDDKAYRTLTASTIYRSIFFKDLFNKEFNIENTYWKHLCKLTGSKDFEESLAYIELNHYLTEDLLTKTDRCSMQHALEVRVPLLDHELIQSMLNLPHNMKRRGKTTKWILKEILKRYIPAELWNRSKQGFVPPMGEWLKGPLNSIMHDYLDENRLKKSENIETQYVSRLIKEHESGANDHQQILWTLISWEMWKGKIKI